MHRERRRLNARNPAGPRRIGETPRCTHVFSGTHGDSADLIHMVDRPEGVEFQWPSSGPTSHTNHLAHDDWQILVRSPTSLTLIGFAG